MANILGLKGFNTSGGTNLLLAGYGNDIVNVDTGLGYQQNIASSNNQEMEVFLDRVFWQNFSDSPRTFNGSAWSKTDCVTSKTPKAKFIKRFDVRLYLGYLNYLSTDFASRVWYSNLPENNKITWGLEYGTGLTQTTLSAVVSSDGAKFKSKGIVEGDEFVITTGPNTGSYRVNSVDKETQITLTEALQYTSTVNSFWVGSNYFDVATNNNDVLTWLEESNNRLLCFKKHTLHRYDKNSLVMVKGAPGTNSGRSVINHNKGVTLYFYGNKQTSNSTGIYLYDGVGSKKISNAIERFIKSISPSIYPSIVGIDEGDFAKFYVGNLSDTNDFNPSFNISKTRAVLTYNVVTNDWKIDEIGDVIKVTTKFEESNELSTFIGNDSGQVYETENGYSFGSSTMGFDVELMPFYPRGTEVENNFTRIKIYSRNARGVSVYYKLWNDPYKVDDKFYPLGDLVNNMTEFIINTDHNISSGIQLKFLENGSSESNYYIEKIVVYSYAEVDDSGKIDSQ